jgi:hypothetical protein
LAGVAFWHHDAKTPRECSGRCQKILVKAAFVAISSPKTTLLLKRNFYVRLEAFDQHFQRKFPARADEFVMIDAT